MARSSSLRSESKLRKSTPVNWDVTMPVAMRDALDRGCWCGRKDRRKRGATGGEHPGSGPLAEQPLRQRPVVLIVDVHAAGRVHPVAHHPVTVEAASLQQ